MQLVDNEYLHEIKAKLHKDGAAIKDINITKLQSNYWDLCKIAILESEAPSYQFICKSAIKNIDNLYKMILASNIEYEQIRNFLSLNLVKNYYQLFYEAITVNPKAINYVLEYRNTMRNHEFKKLIKHALKTDIKTIIYMDAEDLKGNILNMLYEVYIRN